jgi:hypothetical protein
LTYRHNTGIVLFQRAANAVKHNITAILRRPSTRAFRPLIIFLCIATPILLGAGNEPRTITFILSGESTVYKRVADAAIRRIRNQCNAKQTPCKVPAFNQLETADAATEENQQAFLTISLGTKATGWIEHQDLGGSKIYAMLPYKSYHEPADDSPKPLAKLFIDQPYERYFDLIKTAIPRIARVGLLVHESDLDLIELFTQTAKQKGLLLKTSIVSSDRSVGEALSYLLEDIDVLLALPDSRIHNNQTIYHILTTAYRNNIPVIGFSSAYVKAGAIAAVYTSPDDIARQISDAVTEYLSSGRINEQSQHANYFSVSFNFEVARSLNLPPIPPSEIKEMILRGVGK